MECRHCGSLLKNTFVDLGFAPYSNSYLSHLNKSELFHPLKIKVCNNCWLVQTEDYTSASELFTDDYAYFSSTSKSWLSHSKKFANEISIELNLGSSSLVVEIASNDGYLLKNFKAKGIPCYGIEPTKSTADECESMGIRVVRKFFGSSLANKLNNEKADLIIGNNVYAHVPDINDFTKGLKILLKENGVITLEFPHLISLIEKVQFDTIYHEHFSYLSLITVSKIFASSELRIWKADKISTHGGSLRIYGCHANDLREDCVSVKKIIKEEVLYGLNSIDTYLSFQPKVEMIKNNLLKFLIHQKNNNKKVIAYGAAAKGNTLLNYAGIKPDLLPLVVDASLSKQNKYMPGSHIPIKSPEELLKLNPDYIFILPWNIADEIVEELSDLKNKKIEFFIAVPEIKVM